MLGVLILLSYHIEKSYVLELFPSGFFKITFRLFKAECVEEKELEKGSDSTDVTILRKQLLKTSPIQA